MEGPLAFAFRDSPDAARALVEKLVDIFGAQNVYVELQRHRLREEERRNQAALSLARHFKLPLIATNGVSHATVEERELMDVLTCIRHKVTIAEAGRLLAKNSECHIKSSQEMARLFADLPEALSQARELAVRLSYTRADLGYQFPPYPVPEGETMNSFLRQLTVTGARDRYGSYQLLLDENGLGNHRTRTAGTGESGDCRNQM